MVDSSRVVRFILFSRCVAILVAVVGVVVLFGWWQNITAFKSILPTLASMKANTALCFWASGTALFFINSTTRVNRRIARLLALGVITFAGLSLIQYFGVPDLGIDQLLFFDDSLASAHPGRMAPATAVMLLLSGSALLLMDWSHLVSRRLAVLAFMLATLGLAGYVFGAPSLYQVSAYTSVAAHTAVALILLNLGIVAARPSDGYMEIIVGDTSGGLMARRLLLLNPLLLFAYSWLVYQGVLADFYDERFALAIDVVSGLAISSVVIMGVARPLHLLDIKRQQTQEQLARLSAKLASANLQLKTEIVERKLAEEEVRRLSLTDELTGLLNRRGFLLFAERDLNAARRANTVHELIYIDLDGLKIVNDTHGHKAGDAMLQDAARVLKETFRDTDTVARLGGDEFAVLAATGEPSEIFLARLDDNIAQFSKDSACLYSLAFSSGVLQCLPGDKKTILELLSEADALMYKQKEAHRHNQKT